MAIGVAIVGSGIFAREEHLPAVQKASDFGLKAIYSRSLASARNLAAAVSRVDLYAEDAGNGKGYSDLLARKDIEAVIIALPILVQPDFIKKALAAGKHVLSEKPVAKDLATAQELIKWYHANIDTSKVFWGVAENFRYLKKFLFAADQVRQLGAVKAFRVNMHTLVKPDAKYYNTAWRKTPDYQGGFVLDGGVHFVAGTRLILGPNDPVVTLSAHSSLLQAYLPPIDTVDAVMKTSGGATGTVSISFGSLFSDFSYEFSCENGVVALTKEDVTVNGQSQNIEYDGSGVTPEVVAFAAAIAKSGPLDKRQVPEEALADLEIIEKILTSGEEEGKPQKLTLQS